MQIRRVASCGTYELHGVRGFIKTRGADFIRTFRRECQRQGHVGWDTPGIVLFSDAKTQGRRRGTTHGERLAAFIRTEGLGTVIEGEWVTNPNTTNLIKYWIWHCNADNITRLIT